MPPDRFAACRTAVLDTLRRITLPAGDWLSLRVPLLYLVQTHFADSLQTLGCVAPTVSGMMAAYTLIFAVHQFKKDLKNAV